MLSQQPPSDSPSDPPSEGPPTDQGESVAIPMVRMRLRDQWHQKLPIIHIKATYNNTLFSITDHTGRVLAWTSSVRVWSSGVLLYILPIQGSCGFKNARRGTTFAAQSAAMTAAQVCYGYMGL